MTLDELKLILTNTALAHKEVKTFDFGESFEQAINGNYNYPAIFMEIPVLVQYSNNGNDKTFTFAIDVFGLQSYDDKVNDFANMSSAEVIGDAYFSKLSADNKTLFRISDINAVTFRNQTDDNLAGVRYELVITTNREFCNNFNDEFN